MKFFKLVILFFVMTVLSCHRDDFENDLEETITYSPVIFKEIISSVTGYVYDENNKPVPNAKVSLYSASTETNEQGLFVFTDIKMDQLGTFIKVTKDGYFTGSDRLYPNSSAASHSYIKMIAQNFDKSFEASQGGTIEITGGGTITFPANSIKKSNGGIYDGSVKIATRFLDPTDIKLGDLMPGGLIGIDFKGSTVALGTAGMFAAELKGSDGSLLNIADGMKATFVIPANSPAKPATIPTWSFDENAGVWKEEGIAYLNGNNYSGEVSHFSFWNCDAPFPVINVCGRVVDQFGSAIGSASVKVEVETANGNFVTSTGYTDDNGNFCGLMPKNSILKITVNQVGCSGNGQTVTVGPFDNNVQLDEIIINLTLNQLEGEILCSGSLQAKSVLVLKQGLTTVTVPSVDGKFNLNIKNFFCSQDNIELFAYDPSNNKTSKSQDFAIGITNYSIELCDIACDLQGEFTSICETITISVNGGSGIYNYQWNTGANTSSIPSELLTASVYSVTVTDANDVNCSQVFSKNIAGKIKVKINADNCSYPVTLSLEGYNYENVYWSTGETTNYINVSPGVITTYSVSVTSADGCLATADIVVDPAKFIYMGQMVSCSKNLFTLDAYFTYGNLIGENQYSKTLSGPGDLVNLNVFETGYKLTGIISDSKCETVFDIDLPRYDGLNITNYMSGETISGNVIQYNTNGNCYNCQTGSVGIYNINDLNTDLVTQNSSGLPPGYYYVVVTNGQTGCFVAHKKVKIL